MRIDGFSYSNYATPYENVQKNNTMPLSGNKEETGVKELQGNGECQTCKNRRYVDGSNEMDVSFKSPGHISPEASKAQVSAHEQMHVSNARAEGSKQNKELVSASVRINMARCPECGAAYAAGGETTTVMRVTKPNYNTDNPYASRQKMLDESRLAGSQVSGEC